MILTQEQRRVYDAILAVRTQKREKRLLPDFCLSVELVYHLGPQNACKAAEIAGDTTDYGKTKGKILLEKGKVKDGKEELGGYVYNTLKNGGELDQSRLDELMAEIDVHLAEIAKLEAEAEEAKGDTTE